MFHVVAASLCRGICRATAIPQSGTAAPALKFLRDGFEQVALDDVAHLIFAEIPQLDAALEADPDFFHVVLETAQGRQSTVVNRLAFAENPRPRRPRDSAIGDETARDDALAQLENPFHFGVADHS